MLLAIDCGNSNTVFAVYNSKEQVGRWSLSTDPNRTADEYAVWLTQLLYLKSLSVDNITEAIITTVVPGTRRNLSTVVQNHF